MASFSLKSEKDSKCRSLNSPVFLKKYSGNQNLKAEAFGWDGCRKKPYESNQSLLNISLYTSEESGKMDAVAANNFNCMKLEKEQIRRQTPVLLPVSYDASFLSDNLLTNSLNFLTSAPNEPGSAHVNNNSKAIFTIHLPSSQILVVNSAACHIMNYSSDELCSMKLENLVNNSQKQKLAKLCWKFLKSSNDIPYTNGKLLELLKKDGETAAVFMYLKQIDNPERCVAILEPLDRKKGLISVNESGKILSCDEDIALIFQYDKFELPGLNVFTLLPALDISKINDAEEKEILQQHITGRTKKGEVFPVSLAVSSNSPRSEEYKIMIWIYTNLNGLIFLNKKLIITNFNSYFIKLLFGFSKKKILNLPIVNLIPSFCTDLEFETNKSNNTINEENSSFWCWKNGSHRDWGENVSADAYLCSFKSSSSMSLNNISDSSKQCDWSSGSLKLEPEGILDFKTLFLHHKTDTVNSEQVGFDNSHFTPQNQTLQEIKANSSINKQGEKIGAPQSNSAFEPDFLNNIMVQEGKFLGFVQHSDGSYIDIKYQVKIAALNEDHFYCIWLSRDLLKFLDLNQGFNNQMVSSFNSASVDSSLAKDSVCSGQHTRPSTASLISQCDENLTAGDYSQYYTNIRQIGKGAFGYVKMAFRNSDGLLVVTKFIKKQNINIRSWVFHSNLNMKIPLEISLLTTLHHPNIVKVLDVFHNDSFVQLVMEKHGAGFDLFEFINRGPNCDEKLKSYIFRQIISAVYYLDSLGILHRDIKDENVIINEKFEIKLIDFGSATFMPSNETFSKFYGTVEYCSPEVLQGNSYKGPELEIWALGVTLYVLTFGENPFYNIEETIQGKFSIPFQISQELDDLLHQMLDKKVETRITIGKVVQHSWINQPVFIENYRFEDIVKCSKEEADPPKYVHEINSEDLCAKNSRTDSNRLGGTNNSSGSLQNLAELDDFDVDNFQEAQKSSLSNIVGRKTNVSSILLSTTPVQFKSDRLCKSANAVSHRSENSVSLSDSSYRGYVSKCENEFILKNNFFKHFTTTSSSENESGGVGDVFNIYDSESEMSLKSCGLPEDNFQKSDSSQSDVFHKKVHELFSKNGSGKFLGPEIDEENDRFNSN